MQIPTPTLIKILKICGSVTSKREKDELLHKGFVISCDEDSLFVGANGNYNAVIYNFSQAEFDSITDIDEFSHVIELGKTLSIVAKSKKDTIELTTKSKKDGLVMLKAEGKSFLRFVDSNDLPEFPQVDETLVEVDIEHLRDIVGFMKPFVSEEVTKTAIIGVCFSEGNIYASDESKSLTLHNTNINIPFEIVISSEIYEILELITSFEDSPSKINICSSTDSSYLILDLISDNEEDFWSCTIFIRKFNIEYPVKQLDKANSLAQANPYKLNFSIDKLLPILDRLDIFVDLNDLLFFEILPEAKTIKVSTKNVKTDEKYEEFLPISDLVFDGTDKLILCTNYSSFYTTMKNFSAITKTMEMTFSNAGKFRAVSFHDKDYDLWFTENVMQFDAD